MFDNYPPGVSPANSSSPKPVVDIYAGLAQAPAVAGSQLSQPANQSAYANLPPMEPEQGGGSLKFLVIGLVTLVLALGGAVIAYQMVLKPKFSSVAPVVELSTEPVVTEESLEDFPIVSSTDSAETQIVYTSASSSVTSSLDLPNELGTSSSSAVVAQMVAQDTDADGLSDDLELLKGTNKNVSDTDGDTLSDAEEINSHQTDPLKSDTDGDGLTDAEEINKYQTKALQADTDSDGFSDGQEVKNNYNPLGSGRLIAPKA